MLSAGEREHDTATGRSAWAHLDGAFGTESPKSLQREIRGSRGRQDKGLIVIPVNLPPPADLCQVPDGAAAGQAVRVRHNPPLSGAFQPLTWVRMWGSGRVAE